MEDVACIALNMLPGRYVRYEIDAEFYNSMEEKNKLIENAKSAILKAAKIVQEHPRS